jgi:hypothetical protein
VSSKENVEKLILKQIRLSSKLRNLRSSGNGIRKDEIGWAYGKRNEERNTGRILLSNLTGRRQLRVKSIGESIIIKFILN